MAIDLTEAKQSVKEAAADLDLRPDLISKWKRLWVHKKLQKRIYH